ncbi:MAG: Mur ligase family protein, partial [Spirochaetaceae bacterium]|nr:Mur ligase family protein [Spirochaetaceae bacterium]
MADAGFLFTAAEAASALGASLVGSAEARIVSVVVDSRQVAPLSLFVALPGAKVDGHEFANAALAAGASCVLARADRRAFLEPAVVASPGAAFLFVGDVLVALQALARAHRRRFPSILRVGITGSSGKTTTKECAAAILGKSRKLVMNPGNLNSDIGLPLSIFAMRESHEIGVFEMGMNRAGEMGELAAVYEPDIALITNVGIAHIGIIGSRDKIAQEKKNVFSRFDGS